jgi:hypothetical protein
VVAVELVVVLLNLVFQADRAVAETFNLVVLRLLRSFTQVELQHNPVKILEYQAFHNTEIPELMEVVTTAPPEVVERAVLLI